MKIGIIGTGSMATKMAVTLQPLKGAECYAVASRNIDKARDFANKYGFQRAYGSYAEMLSDPNVVLVYIATPHSEHYENIKMALNHGKHVLCEKPLCANAKQGEEVMLMAEDMGLLLTEAMWTRYMPMREIINKVITSGIIGNPTSLSANLGYPLKHIERMVSPKYGGGALLDLGVYALNFASMVFGNEISSVAANCVKLDSGVDAQENIMLTYADGRMASMYSTMLAQTDRRGFINGTNGYIEIENINNYESLKVFNLERKIVAEYTAPTQITGYEYEVMSAMRAISLGHIECAEMPHADSLIMLQLMDSIRAAWGIVFPFEEDPGAARSKALSKANADLEKINKKDKASVTKLSENSISEEDAKKTFNPARLEQLAKMSQKQKEEADNTGDNEDKSTKKPLFSKKDKSDSNRLNDFNKSEHAVDPSNYVRPDSKKIVAKSANPETNTVNKPRVENKGKLYGLKNEGDADIKHNRSEKKNSFLDDKFSNPSNNIDDYFDDVFEEDFEDKFEASDKYSEREDEINSQLSEIVFEKSQEEKLSAGGFQRRSSVNFKNTEK